MSRRLLSALGLAVALTIASAPTNAAAPPPAKHTPYSAYSHNGFLMRLSAGFGYTRASWDIPGKLELTGGGGLASLAFGGMIAENLALNADIFGSSAFEPTASFAGIELGDVNDTTMSVGALGVGVTYYLMPANVYFALSFGPAIGRIAFDDGNGRSERRTSDVGFAVNAMIGKEWWVGREWGIGIAGQLMIGNLPSADGDIHPFAVGVALTATYN